MFVTLTPCDIIRQKGEDMKIKNASDKTATIIVDDTGCMIAANQTITIEGNSAKVTNINGECIQLITESNQTIELSPPFTKMPNWAKAMGLKKEP